MLGQCAESLFKVLPVFEVSHTNTVSRDLGRVSGANTLFGGSDFVASQSILQGSINCLVEIKDQVGSVGNENTTLVVNSLLGKAIEFLQEGRQVNDDTVSDNSNGLGVQDSTGKQVELIFDSVDDDCVPSIRSSGNSCADIVFLSDYSR